MSKVAFGRPVNVIDDAELDELLSKLTPEEIEELNNELDPDNSLMPPSERCKDQTKKTPTGPYNRSALVKFLEDKAKNEADWEQNAPFEHKMRGKVFDLAKLQQQKVSNQDLRDMGFEAEFDDEVEEALKNASEEELVDLAAILGFTGMLNQVQYNASLENKEQICGGFSGVAKHEKFKIIPDEPPNNTDVEGSIKKVEANDKGLEELNLNNIKNITTDEWTRLAKALHENTALKKLKCSNTGLTNTQVGFFIEAMEKNTGLTHLSLESNFLTGDVIVRLVKAISTPKSNVSELHLANQRQRVMGVRSEMELSQVLQANKKLQKLGVDLETMDARYKVRSALATNIDENTRLKRRA